MSSPSIGSFEPNTGVKRNTNRKTSYSLTWNTVALMKELITDPLLVKFRALFSYRRVHTEDNYWQRVCRGPVGLTDTCEYPRPF